MLYYFFQTPQFIVCGSVVRCLSPVLYSHFLPLCRPSSGRPPLAAGSTLRYDQHPHLIPIRDILNIDKINIAIKLTI